MLHVPRIRGWLGTSLLLLAAFHSAITQAADESPGLESGTAAPAFSLPDQQGKQQQLADLVKQGNVAIVFYRSADW